MLEAPQYSAAGGQRRAAFQLPEGEYDGTVNEAVLYHSVRAYLNNQRQGTAKTKTRSEVSGGGQKPWRQKGTGRARQGTIRAAHWRGGGTVFGPIPRSYRTELPRRVRQLARRSALNARAREGSLLVIEALEFEAPKTALLADLLAKVGVVDRKVLLLTDGLKRNVYLSGRNMPAVRVLPYTDAAAYHILWSDVVVVEVGALGGAAAPAEGEAAEDAAAAPKRAAPRRKKAAPKAAKAKAAPKKTAKRATKATAKKRATKASAKKKKKKGGD